MKRINLLLCTVALSFAINAIAQDATATVEKSLFNVQTGPVGLWVNNEIRPADQFTLRTEVGLDLWTYDTNNDGLNGAFLAPSISFEPRWYYNLKKRAAKGKNVAKNSANIITVAVKLYPDTFTIGGHPDNVNIPNQLTIVPKWIMRRHIGKTNFNYEFGGGVGYIGYLSDTNYNINYGSDVAIDLHARIGYTF